MARIAEGSLIAKWRWQFAARLSSTTPSYPREFVKSSAIE
jgi:hypothetical protein